MSVITKTKKSINLTENVYQREKWIVKLVKTAKAYSTPTEKQAIIPRIIR